MKEHTEGSVSLDYDRLGLDSNKKFLFAVIGVRMAFKVSIHWNILVKPIHVS